MISSLEMICGGGGGLFSVMREGEAEEEEKTGKSRVFRKRLQKLLCVIGSARCATFAVWFEKFNFQQK